MRPHTNSSNSQRNLRPVAVKKRDRILVVDDDRDARELVATVLTETGYQVDIAEDGFSAMRLLTERTPDLVLSDLRMPGMHGVDLIHNIRAARRDMPVILMTGSNTYGLVTGAEAYGAVACLVKPIKLDELLWQIDCALATRPRSDAVVQSLA